jgi:hypothetical protein
MPDTPNAAPVTREDRDAAWPHRSFHITDTVASCKAWNDGQYDAERIVLAFRDHRLAAEAQHRERAERAEGAALVLAGHHRAHGETPSMTASSREHWKRRAEAAEAKLATSDQMVGEDKYLPFVKMLANVADEYDRWQRKGSTTAEQQVRFGYGRCQFGMKEFRAARALLPAVESESGA